MFHFKYLGGLLKVIVLNPHPKAPDEGDSLHSSGRASNRAKPSGW